MSDGNALSENWASFVLVRDISDTDFHEQGIIKASDLESVKQLFGRSSNQEQPSSAKIQELTVNDLSDLGKGIWHFYDQLKSYYEVAFVVDLIASGFARSFFKSQIVRHSEENFKLIETIEGCPIYGLNHIDSAHIERKIERWREMSTGFDRLPSSILLSIVATFDSAFADFTRALLRARPQRYTGSDRQYSVAEILSLGSLDDLISKVIDDEVDQQMNKSHTDQIAFFEKSFDIKIRDKYDRWQEFIEIFERRNLAAHGSLIVNERYLKNCGVSGQDVNSPKVSDKLEVSQEYIVRSLDNLIEFGVLLSLAAWQKQIPASIKESFEAVVEVSFSLLQAGRARPAVHVLEYALSVKGKGARDDTIKMMTVNLAIARKMLDKSCDITKIIDVEDWSAAGIQFKLCIAAVREDVEAVCKLLPIAKAAGEIGPMAIREWPAFQWVRDAKLFKEKFVEVFEEPLDNSAIVRSSPEEDEE